MKKRKKYLKSVNSYSVLKMQFFLPFWPGDDIYEKFDPLTERANGKQLKIWQVFKKPPLDGILVSRANLEKTENLKRKAESMGIHKALEFNGPIMGDCGAFSYVNEPEPPLPYKDVIGTLKFYKRLGFDVGVTVDHLIVNTIKTLDGKKHS